MEVLEFLGVAHQVTLRLAYEQARKEKKALDKKILSQIERVINQDRKNKRGTRESLVLETIYSLYLEVDKDFKNSKNSLNKYRTDLIRKFEDCASAYYDKRVALEKIKRLYDEELTIVLDEQWQYLKTDEFFYFKEEAREYLNSKINVVCYLYNEEFKKILAHIYNEKTNGKQYILNMLDNMSFSEGIQLLKKFRYNLNEMNGFSKEQVRFVDGELKEELKKYMIFYDYALVLIGKKLNELSYNKDKNTYIDEEKYHSALRYFYENDSIEAIKELIKKKTYLKNKSMGNRGEEVVDYALSWLPKQYINMPQASIGRYGQECILLQNENYRSEKQEYDHIIVGPQGVFLVETKNYAGEIIIDEDGNWTRKKSGQEIVGERNPIQQIRRHEKLMQSIVPDINIISIMCLSHPKVIVNGANNSSVKILKSDLLCEYIENYKVDNTLNEEQVQRVVDKIKSYIV